MIRPHCQQPDACQAAKPTTHCRRCSILRVSRDPAMEAKRVERIRALYEDPDYLAAHKERLQKSVTAARKRPEVAAKLREHGRRQYRECLSRPDVVARNRAPDVRKAAGRKTSEKRMGWCPQELREQYRRMVITDHIPAVEARRIIEELIPGTAAHANLAIASADLGMRLKHEREKAQAY